MKYYYSIFLIFGFHIFLHAQQAGDLDPTFAVGNGFNSSVRFVGVQPNGNIFVGGEFTQYQSTAAGRYVILNPNGMRDSTFVANTTTGANFSIRSGYVLPSGNILIGGIFSSINGTTTPTLSRLSANGQLSSAFNTGGSGPSNEVTHISFNGSRIAISGFFNAYNGTTTGTLAVILPNGALDPTFSLQSGFNLIHTTAFESGGKMYIGGNFSTANGASQNRIARLHINGSLDTSFNVGSGASSPVSAIAVQADGKVIIAGAFTSYNGVSINRIARLHTNGTLDTTFNVGTGFSSTVRHLLIQPNGKIICTGLFNTYNGNSTPFLVRLNVDGSIDQCFNTGSGLNGSTEFSALQPDGKILVGGGFSQYKGVAQPRLMRLYNDSASGASKPTLTQNSFTVGCVGDSISVSITKGQLSDAPRWEWYIDSCNGTPIDTGWTGNFIINSPATYYVKGQNASDCNCTSFQVSILDTEAPVPDMLQLPDLESYCEIEIQQIPTATDNCVGTVTATTNDTLFYDQPGNYTITWHFDDGNGNTSSQQQNVNIYAIDTGITALGNNQWQANHTSPTAKYQWGVCIFGQFVPIASDTMRVFTLPNTGEIAVIITEGDCSDTTRCFFLFTNSIDERNNQRVSVFPNPTDGLFQIESLNPWQQMEVLDLTGQSVHIENSFTQKIDIQHLPAGMYLVKIIFNNNGRDAIHRISIIK
jgi:uncharacterized delta-60 repeat protein